tara:strand:- start:1169 stop:1630 length:462 start_codon:yes stop_codon:yes gene_type:complete
MQDNFKVKDECSFKLYPEIKETVILDALIGECVTYDLPEEISYVLIEAWNSRFWIAEGYDGATVIHNKKHPSIANFLHDYFYRMGFAGNYRGGKRVDIIYKEVLKLTGYKKTESVLRYSAIRLFGSFLRVGHRLRGNNKKLSMDAMDLYIRLK